MLIYLWIFFFRNNIDEAVEYYTGRSCFLFKRKGESKNQKQERILCDQKTLDYLCEISMTIEATINLQSSTLANPSSTRLIAENSNKEIDASTSIMGTSSSIIDDKISFTLNDFTDTPITQTSRLTMSSLSKDLSSVDNKDFMVSSQKPSSTQYMSSVKSVDQSKKAFDKSSSYTFIHPSSSDIFDGKISDFSTKILPTSSPTIEATKTTGIDADSLSFTKETSTIIDLNIEQNESSRVSLSNSETIDNEDSNRKCKSFDVSKKYNQNVDWFCGM